MGLLFSSVLMMVVSINVRFGSQSKNFSSEQVARTTAAADRPLPVTLLHTLYQQNTKTTHHYFLREVCAGSGEKPVMARWWVVLHCASKLVKWFLFKARATVLATGGQGAFISPPLTPTLTLATASARLSAQAYRCRIGNVVVPPDRYCRCGRDCHRGLPW